MRLTRLVIPLAGLLAAGPVWAADSLPTNNSPDLSGIRASLKAQDYQGALTRLRRIEGANPRNADVMNLLGFASRKTGDWQRGAAYYQRALALDPNHRGALEYQGELFVERGQMDDARANLARLAKLCPAGCEERSDLQAAIDKVGKKK